MKLTINCLGRELYLVLQQLRGGGDRGQAGGAQEELAQDLGQEGGHRDWGCQPLPRSGETLQKMDDYLYVKCQNCYTESLPFYGYLRKWDIFFWISLPL